jgi:hypothetical protein
MTQFVAKVSGLTIQWKESVTERGLHGNITKIVPAKRIQFINGSFQTEDEDQIEFLREYARRRKTIREITEADKLFARQQAEYLAHKSGRRPGSQGPATNPVSPEPKKPWSKAATAPEPGVPPMATDVPPLDVD